jgi:hypothetical protein
MYTEHTWGFGVLKLKNCCLSPAGCARHNFNIYEKLPEVITAILIYIVILKC